MTDLLSTLGLSADAVARRVRSIGGSDANTIMGGDETAILSLWEQKTGRRPPDDLTGVLPVVMGSFTEPLNLAWFTKQTGLTVTRQGEHLAHQKDTWRTATLDGFSDGAVVECKHVGSFWKNDDILAKYQPQLHHQMDVCGVTKAHLSVFKGNADWLHFEVDYDPDYGAAVRKAELAFWHAVQADEPPVPYPAPPPPAPTTFREVDMGESNEWGFNAVAWVENKVAAKKYEDAAKALKALVEADVSRAHGRGVEITRSKAGALTVKAIKETK